MADNTTLNPGAGGDVIATDDVAGVKYQVVKLAVGADGAAALVADANPIPVSDAGGALTVDGTVAVTHAALTELAGAIDTEVQCDIVSSALPTGASTSANQTTIIGHLDGVEGLLTTIDADTGAIAAAIKAEDAVHGSGDSGIMALAVRQNSQVDLGADGDYVPLTVDDSGGVRVSIVAGAGSGGTAAADDADFTATTTQGTPAMGVYESAPSSVTDGDLGIVGITQTRAMKVAIDSGGVTGRAEDAAHASGHEGIVMLAVRRDTAAVGSDTDGDYSTINVDSVGAQWVRGTSEIADDAAFTAGTSRVRPVGFFADEASTDSVDEGDIGAARMTLDRKQIVTPYVHAAAGGWTPHKNLDVDETEDDIKTSPGKLGWIHVINRSTGVRYIKFYNDTAANVSVGTTTPVLSFPVPTMADTNGAGFCINFGDAGVQFSTAICVAATTGVADNDTGAPGANDVVLNCGYL